MAKKEPVSHVAPITKIPPKPRKHWVPKDEIAFTNVISLMHEGQSLNKITKNEAGLPNIPAKGTFLKWCAQDPEWDRLYTLATLARADVLFEEIIDISDTVREGEIIKQGGKHGTEVTTKDMVERATLQVRARMWCVERMNRKKYGSKITQEHVGADGGPMQTQTVNMTKELTQEELAAELEKRGIRPDLL